MKDAKEKRMRGWEVHLLLEGAILLRYHIIFSIVNDLINQIKSYPRIGGI